MNLPPFRAAFATLLLAAASSLPAISAPTPILVEDFESTAVGEAPKGFSKTGAVEVVEDVAHSGHKSLRLGAAQRGSRLITLQGAPLAALGGDFWGRLYFKVKLPAPLPVVPEGKTSAGIHSTLVSGKAVSPLHNDPIEVRLLGTSTDMTGAFKYLYNVQPRGGRKEFGASTKARFHYSADWVLAEWQVEHSTQSYRLFIDGQEVSDISLHKGAGQFEGLELPAAFESLSFGFTNYQPASGEGFVVWIDDLALSKERLGPLGAKGAGAAR